MKTVLFLCEHGAAKSVVAATHFNELARQRGLPYRAYSRGTDPDPELHPAAVAGLQRDGLTAESTPQRVSVADLDGANEIVAFGDLPLPGTPAQPVTTWNVPAVSEDYEASREAIVALVRRLQEDLARRDR